MTSGSYYSILEIAKLLGIAEHRIAYAHRSGKLTEPVHVAGKRIYSASDIERIAYYFGLQRKEEKTWSDS
jgi:DNA-binding transcriptional MerR regulator